MLMIRDAQKLLARCAIGEIEANSLQITAGHLLLQPLSASGRSDSSARQWATKKAVSDTCSIEAWLIEPLYP